MSNGEYGLRKYMQKGLIGTYRTAGRSGYPYIHATGEGYKNSGHKMETTQYTREVYAQQAKRMNKLAQVRLGVGDEQKAADRMREIEKFLKKTLDENDIKEQTNFFIKDKYREKLPEKFGKSFYTYSDSQKKRQELVQDMASFEQFIDALGSVMEQYEKVPKDAFDILYAKANLRNSKRNPGDLSLSWDEKDVNAILESKGVSYPVIVADSKANTGLIKLNIIVGKLKEIANAQKEAQKLGGKLTPTQIREGEQYLRNIKGHINNLVGGYFEYGLEVVLNNSIGQLLGDIKTMGAGMKGQNTVSVEGYIPKELKSELKRKKVTSKTDVSMTIQDTQNGNIMELGLSLKTTKQNEKGERKSTFSSGQSVYDLMIRNGILFSEVNYHFLNNLAHGNQAGVGYNGLRNLIGAYAAMTTLSGVGSRKDTAFFVVYYDKVVSIADYMARVSTGQANPLSVSIVGKDNAVSNLKAWNESRLNNQVKMVNRYKASREKNKAILQGLKTTISGDLKF